MVIIRQICSVLIILYIIFAYFVPSVLVLGSFSVALLAILFSTLNLSKENIINFLAVLIVLVLVLSRIIPLPYTWLEARNVYFSLAIFASILYPFTLIGIIILLYRLFHRITSS